MSSWWFVYIVECGDGSLYTGATNDLRRRVDAHASGKGAKYTRARLPVRLVYSRRCDDKSTALKVEYALKQLSREQKLELIHRRARRLASQRKARLLRVRP